ncbi:MAG: HAMP domain-containing sensor histidine kinase [Pyrinomonadaceae bacterium]
MKRSWLTYLMIGGLAVLLVALGLLQYRWMTQISASDGEKAKVRVKDQADRLAGDFNREIQNAYFNFQTDADSWKNKDWAAFNERYQYWTENTTYPTLIKEFYFFEAKGDGQPLRYDRGVGFADVDPATAPEYITVRLRQLKQRLADPNNFKPVQDDLDTLFLPIHLMPVKGEKMVVKRDMPLNQPTLGMPEPYGYLAIELDRDTMTGKMIPELVAKYFDANEFRVQVSDKAGNAVFREVYASEADATAQLLDVTPNNFVFFANRDLMDKIGEKRQSVVVNSKVETHSFEHRGETKGGNFTIEMKGSKPRTSVFTATTTTGDVPGGPWQLGVQHLSGSLDGYIASTLRRNLAIGFGILFLLAAAVAAIIISSMRARALAQRQLDFVSSVSHEFRTPLAVIYSAGENLADGVAKETVQVSRYGDLIKGEGRKLSSMVEQILEFAGANSGRRKFNFKPTPIVDIVNDAVEESRSLIDDRGFEMETLIADGLPVVSADKNALSQAIQNLIANSIKYCNGDAWLRVSASNGDGKVKIIVEDRGIGISKGDLKQIFEPFFRSKEVVDAQIHGNGLGLSLVKQITEAHGGRVRATSELGKGSKFTIEIPS